MKITIGILLLVCCTVIGYLFSTKYVEKNKFFEHFTAFNLKMTSEISFSKTTVLQVVKKLDIESLFNSFIYSFYVDKKPNYSKIKFLKADEKDFIINYLNTLGSADGKTQTEFISSATKELSQYADIAKVECKKYRTLCIKLGFLFGLIILIIVI